MTIGHDLNSLNSSSVTLFTKDKTSLQVWADEETSRISQLSNENNLDPSYHGARVAIISKTEGGAIDPFGDPNLLKTPVIRWPRTQRSPNQWIRLEKVDPKQITSPWYIRCDYGGTSRYNQYIADEPGSLSNAQLVVTPSTMAQWRISWDSEGYYRIKNVQTGWYISNSTEKSGTGKDDEKRYLIETRYRAETDLQLWKVEKLSNPFLDCDDNPPHLDGIYHNKTVAIVTISGWRSMDIGGQGERIYLRFTDTTNVSQKVKLEKVNDKDAKSAWRIRGKFDKDNGKDKDWGVALRDPKGVVRHVPDDNSQEQQWYFKQTPSGAYRIQNVKNQYYLEWCEPWNNDNNLKLDLSDKGSGSEQLFTIIMLQ